MDNKNEKNFGLDVDAYYYGLGARPRDGAIDEFTPSDYQNSSEVRDSITDAQEGDFPEGVEMPQLEIDRVPTVSERESAKKAAEASRLDAERKAAIARHKVIATINIERVKIGLAELPNPAVDEQTIVQEAKKETEVPSDRQLTAQETETRTKEWENGLDKSISWKDFCKMHHLVPYEADLDESEDQIWGTGAIGRKK